MHLQANGILLDPCRTTMLSPELDCIETWRLNQVANAQVENGVDCMSEGDDVRVGEATGEEGTGERGGGAVVRGAWASLASMVSGWAKGFAQEAWEEVWEERQFSERRIRRLCFSGRL